MLQKIRNHIITKWVAIGIIPGFLFPFASYAEINKTENVPAVSRVNVNRVVTAQPKLEKLHTDKTVETALQPQQFEADVQAAIASVGGPTDANYQGGVSNGEMVDLSSGAFNYSIPLVDVGGYPITLNYDADVSMTQQASLVGLGWSLSTEAINRTVRGIPDDFKGDEITTSMNLRPRLTVINKVEINGEYIGLDFPVKGLDLEFGYLFNNYTGNESFWGLDLDLGVSVFSDKTSGPNAMLGLGIKSSARSGLSHSISVNKTFGNKYQFAPTLGINRNTLYGSSLTTSFGFSNTLKSWKSDISKKRSRSSKVGFTMGGAFPLSMQSYTPTASFEFQTKTWSFQGAAGYEWPLTAAHVGYNRTKTTVCLKEKVKSEKAFGYMNLEDGYAEDAIQDFNLQLPTYHENMQGVSTPMPTNDYFIVPGSGMFRAIRSDVGYVKDPTTTSNSNSNAFSGDGAIGAPLVTGPVPLPPPFSVGVNYAYSNHSSESAVWKEDNPFSEGETPTFEYDSDLVTGTPEQQVKYEKVRLQKINNGATNTADRYAAMNEDRAVRQAIYLETGDNPKIKAHATMVADEDGVPAITTGEDICAQFDRVDRNEVLDYETNQELRMRGVGDFSQYTMNAFEFGSGDYTGVAPLNRNPLKYKDHHIGEMTLTTTGSVRKVFGIPVMNQSKQVSFSISEINNYPASEGVPDPIVGNDGLVSYSPGDDNSLDNKRGDDHYYMKNETPDHATSYLLTGVYSSNYVDRTGNGATPDDFGDYTKINYSYEGQNNWRFPFEQNEATYDEGFKSNLLDDKAHYSYGKRDDWYIHSIESKDFIAEFEYSDRDDARHSAGENGGAGGMSKKLDKIRLYTRKGKELGEAPVKTVHFNYTYDLCKGTPDNTSSSAGKLTLTSLYFKFHDSPQGELDPYKFNYAANENYDISKVDRWGNFQEHDAIDPSVVVDFAHDSELDNSEYPYSIQDKTTADLNAANWKLSSIELPTGSHIEIDYEAGDYEYVQHVEATRMFKIKGFYTTEDDATPEVGMFSEVVFDPDDKDEHNFFIMIDLEGGIDGAETPAEAQAQFEKHYLPRISSYADGINTRYLYYNVLLNLAPHNAKVVDPDAFEYIQGYCQMAGWSVKKSSPSGDWDRVIIKVYPDKIDRANAVWSPKVHPIARKAWQVIKDALPLVMYPEESIETIYAKDNIINCPDVDLDDEGSSTSLSDSSKNHKKNIMSALSVYHMMRKTGYASRAVKSASGEYKGWVRMRPGTDSKVGGSYRVKEVRIYDNWNEFVPGENGAVYGTKYSYTTKNELGDEISSGVASYEPINSGGDEIALREPIFYTQTKKGTPSEVYYTEFPLNEQMFATAQIRYSEVKVSSIGYAGLEKNTPGQTIYSHFTAKDYPIQWDKTNIEKGTKLKPPGKIGAATGFNSVRRFGLSFGTSVVVNDMHGRFRSKRVIDAEGNTIYKMEHIYKENTEGHLENLVATIDENGNKSDRIMGQHEDLMTFLNRFESNDWSVTGKGQLDVIFLPVPPPLVFPSFFPGGSRSVNEVSTSLTSKIVYQSGIIDQIVVEDNGRMKATKNLLYDANTGKALVMEVTPEEGHGIRKLYEYGYPAYWGYERMGQVSQNIGIDLINISGVGAIIEPGKKAYYVPGDELHAYELNAFLKRTSFIGTYWVVEDEVTNDYVLVDKDGDLYVPTVAITAFKTQRSGNKNLTGTQMSSVISLDGPYSGDMLINPYSETFGGHTRVLSITGADFTEKALIRDGCVAASDFINPYRYNILGSWKAEHSYVFDGERDYSTGNSRKDGWLTVYQPFWRNIGGTWLPIYDPGIGDEHDPSDPYQEWIKTESATQFDSYGFNLETESAIGINSSVRTGYNHRLQTNSTSNARYEEALFDGFEDYYVNGIGTGFSFTEYDCYSDHHTLIENRISSLEAHTGRYSLFPHANTWVLKGEVWDGSTSSTPHSIPYQVQSGDMLNTFKLANDEEDNRYVLTVWAKDPSSTDPLNYGNAWVTVKIDGTAISLDEKRSNIIDGWQRLEYSFKVDASYADGDAVEITMGNDVFYDDLRIHPYDSEMESVVFDPVNQRVAANLDGRNFATIYQYDENGTLIRTIQETERGKQTVQEMRSGTKVNY